MPKEDIEKILDAAVQAPSGENCQPWSFKVDLKSNTIELSNLPEIDQSIYNFNQQGSLVSHGCVIENIVLTAGKLGYGTSVDLFPNPNEVRLVARITLNRQEHIAADSLADSIYQRTSNRKKFTGEKLAAQDLLSLQKEVEGEHRLMFIEDPTTIRELAGALSASEQVLFENKTMHDFFFSHINWTLDEEQKKRYGFYIETLELDKKQRKGFVMFKSWAKLSFLNLFGVSKMVRKDNTANYQTASAIGFIIGKEDSPKSYVEAGRAVQRLWLQATRLGLALQPLTGVLYIHKKIAAGKADELSEGQKKTITQAREVLGKYITTTDPLQFAFRLGKTSAPTAHALRKQPEVIFI